MLCRFFRFKSAASRGEFLTCSLRFVPATTPSLAYDGALVEGLLLSCSGRKVVNTSDDDDVSTIGVCWLFDDNKSERGVNSIMPSDEEIIVYDLSFNGKE